ncbi:putative coiled-coil domain-containing protein 195 [Pipra filicauda]|uniref:Coiled-coil domain-containing protein 195 n=1 Tax=Pipra filicauda TaxID=649802 RepID=A0A7R5KHM7_9PASS|nr:putative coiled-coil domain-containing protein 195 [Pipra filicauda]
MEGNAHLLQVIRKMRSQINKLERENRALKGELQVCGQRAVPPEREAARGGGNSDVRSLARDEEGPAGSPASLQGAIPASPAPAPKEQTGTNESGLSGAVHGTHTAMTLIREEEKGLEKSPSSCCSSYSRSRNMKLFQEHVYRCRGKVKAVSFLLPMHMSPCAEKQSSLKSPENQSTKPLMTIAENDM